MRYADAEEIFQPGKTAGSVEQEAKKVGEGGVRDAVGCPGAVVIHFRDTSGVLLAGVHLTICGRYWLKKV
jgi:hypothetical protein